MKGCESFDPITKQSAGFDAGLPEREEEKPVGIFMVGDPPVTRTPVAPFAQNDTSVGHRMSDAVRSVPGRGYQLLLSPLVPGACFLQTSQPLGSDSRPHLFGNYHTLGLTHWRANAANAGNLDSEVHDKAHPPAAVSFTHSTSADGLLREKAIAAVPMFASDANYSLARSNAEASPSNSGSTITKEHLSQVYHLPQNDAAQALNTSVRKIKQLCGQYGIKRWPHRALQSLDKLCALVKEEAGQATSESSEAVLLRLQTVRTNVLADPNFAIPEDIYRMRDLMHKNEYKDRRSRLASLGKPSLQSSGSHGALSGMHDSSDEGDDVPRGSNQQPSSSGNEAETSGVVLRAETTAVSQSMGGISKQELEHVWRAKLESAYHLPQLEAAHVLGISFQKIKQLCSLYQIGRWPHRKLSSIAKLMETAKASDSPQDTEASRETLDRLEVVRQLILKDPNFSMPDDVSRMRNMKHKLDYCEKRRRGRGLSAQIEDADTPFMGRADTVDNLVQPPGSEGTRNTSKSITSTAAISLQKAVPSNPGAGGRDPDGRLGMSLPPNTLAISTEKEFPEQKDTLPSGISSRQLYPPPSDVSPITASSIAWTSIHGPLSSPDGQLLIKKVLTAAQEAVSSGFGSEASLEALTKLLTSLLPKPPSSEDIASNVIKEDNTAARIAGTLSLGKIPVSEYGHALPAGIYGLPQPCADITSTSIRQAPTKSSHEDPALRHQCCSAPSSYAGFCLNPRAAADQTGVHPQRETTTPISTCSPSADMPSAIEDTQRREDGLGAYSASDGGHSETLQGPLPINAHDCVARLGGAKDAMSLAISSQQQQAQRYLLAIFGVQQDPPPLDLVEKQSMPSKRYGRDEHKRDGPIELWRNGTPTMAQRMHNLYQRSLKNPRHHRRVKESGGSMSRGSQGPSVLPMGPPPSLLALSSPASELGRDLGPGSGSEQFDSSLLAQQLGAPMGALLLPDVTTSVPEACMPPECRKSSLDALADAVADRTSERRAAAPSALDILAIAAAIDMEEDLKLEENDISGYGSTLITHRRENSQGGDGGGRLLMAPGYSDSEGGGDFSCTDDNDDSETGHIAVLDQPRAAPRSMGAVVSHNPGLPHQGSGGSGSNKRQRSEPGSSDKAHRVSKEALQEVYYLPIEQAAEKLGLGLTVFKRCCRMYSVGRWPYRKIVSIDKLLGSLAEDPQMDLAEAERLRARLVEMRQMVHLDPNYELPLEIKQLRQSTYKHEHVQRRQHGTAVVLTDLRKSRPKSGAMKNQQLLEPE